MAGPVTKLRLKFKDSADKDTEMSYSYVKSDITGAQAKAVGDAIVRHKSCFKNNPSSLVSASIVQTTETPIELPS